MSEEAEYNLSESVKGLGKLVPVLKDKHGNIIDGFHRTQVDPNWPSVTVQEVDDPVKLALSRLAVNFCRRRVSADEIRESLVYLIGKCGLKPEQISQATGISLSTVYKYLPFEFKVPEKAAAGMISGEVRRQAVSVPSSEQTVKTQETILATCERCHVSTSQPKNWRGHVLCPQCYQRAEGNPEAYETFFRYLERAKTAPIKPEVWRPAAVDKWEHRAAQMHPQVSTFEVKFSVEAAKAGLPQGESNVPVCLVQTIPDKTYHLPKGDLHVYFDGPVHSARADRDEALREQLRKRGATVLSIAYNEPTDEAIQAALEQVRSELLRLGWTPPKEENDDSS